MVGALRRGDGPTVPLRADMDALPMRDATGLPYASTDTTTDADGHERTSSPTRPCWSSTYAPIAARPARPVLDAIRRIVTAECQASGCPKDPDFELFDRFPLTDNDAATTERVSGAFRSFFGERAHELGQQTASEDFSDIPAALGTPYTYWGVGCIDAEEYRKAADAGRVAEDIPVNHSPAFAPVIQPTLDTGTEALVVAALDWLGS